MWRSIVVAATLLAVVSVQCCVKRQSEERGPDDGHYCVCNATYCDTAPTVTNSLEEGEYAFIVSSKSGLRFHVSRGSFSDTGSAESADRIALDAEDRKQEIVGFGGAVTDSTARNILNLSEDASEKLLGSYFGEEGIEYSIVRLPLGGTDFSDRPYAYAPIEHDYNLEYFSLQPEDYELKIPVMKKALKLRDDRIKLLTAPWSPDPWMKTNNAWDSAGRTRKELWPLYANYFVKYFEAYKREGLDFWALSSQNEPMMKVYAHTALNGGFWTPEEQRDFIVDHLAPALEEAGFGHLLILIVDDNRQFVQEYAETVFGDPKGRKAVSGTAVHWYFDNSTSPFILDEIKEKYPEKMILYTEACTGVATEKRVILGSWRRGEQYAQSIIETLSHWTSGWVDWNMALTPEGGPTWIGNFVDSPVIVNRTADEFYKQPMFYAMGHFSKYVPPGSWRVGTRGEGPEGVEHVAFTTPDNATVLVLLNTNEEEKEIELEDKRRGRTRLSVPAKSIGTLKYW